ncbi:hypothetical protein Fmac_006055 [Flemingia macrophylla]|uniref:Uncharacterized protein n=1 Tax=Flemingia macrophylla TaxID=520843 RepID=A0ABD1N9M7_9FABA
MNFYLLLVSVVATQEIKTPFALKTFVARHQQLTQAFVPSLESLSDEYGRCSLVRKARHRQHPLDMAIGVLLHRNFTNYGTSRPAGINSFKNYSNGLFNTPLNEFRCYSRDATDHDDSFSSYTSEVEAFWGGGRVNLNCVWGEGAAAGVERKMGADKEHSGARK